MTNSSTNQSGSNKKIEFNFDYAVARFSELLIYETVDGNIEECEKFIKALEVLYPNIHIKCELERVAVTQTSPGGLMYRLKGKDSSKSILLMSHFDVVPASKDEKWEAHPFTGGISEGEIYGRGALDTKCTLCAIMESVETLLEQGYITDYDIYMCFGGDEETSGNAAITMSALLKERGVSPMLVVDEGGAIVDASIVGGSELTALIGIAEKGYMDVEFITRGKGGHTSMPTKHNPLSTMAKVINRLDKPFKPIISEPVKIMGGAIIRNFGFKVKVALKSPILRKLLLPKVSQLVPEIGALLQTTGAVTLISGGSAKNVIPEEIRAVGNFRVINGSTVAETLEIIKKTLRGLDVEVNLLESLEPSKISRVEGEGWERLNSAIKITWNTDERKCVIIPYLMIARTDSRFYSEITDYVYRFSPMFMSSQDREAIHGINERISTDAFRKMLEFYLSLITNGGVYDQT
ncbi:MAG: M20/M25/M40 family metallo-hydrolase [Oscillospiraceae bacterium]|nr:M20/M25/M40 family metallo-hydrolase [Oscillospiraceae bacterium]